MHSLISPSGLFRMFECPGSVLASKDIPDHSSPAAERGTLIHKLAEEMLRIGFTDVSGLTHEEAQHLTDYNKFVKGLVDSGSVLYVEEKVSLQAYVSDMFGTIDALIVGEDAMHIIDLKTGSQKVYVEGNAQLMAYALGAASEYGFNKRIFIHIWQKGEHRMAEVDVHELDNFTKKLIETSDIALQENAPRNPSENACRWCKAAPTCPALYKQQLALVGGDFTDLTEPENLTDEQIALIVLNRSRIEQYMKRVFSYALERGTHGNPVAGTKIVEGRAVRRFTNAGKEALVELLGDTAYEKKLIGVTAADALVGKELVDAMTEKRGSPTLAGLDDKRPALTTALDDFEVL